MELGTHDWCHLVTDTHTHINAIIIIQGLIYHILHTEEQFQDMFNSHWTWSWLLSNCSKSFYQQEYSGSACRCQHSVIKSNLRMFTKLMSKGHFLYYWLIVHVWCGSNDWSSLQHVWSIFQNISSLLTKINGEDH